MYLETFKIIRKIMIKLVIVLAVTCTSSNAAEMSALDFNGIMLGKVVPDGSVVNDENELVGHITADGFVVDNEDTLIGGIAPQGIAISVNNEILGKVNNDGTVTTDKNSLIGIALPNGLVVNENYDILGNVLSSGLVYNDRGKIEGRVSNDGKFYNLSGENSGFVTGLGIVYSVSSDKKAVLIGKLISSKIVISLNGNFLGSLAPDGKVIDKNKKIVGNIHANGFVYDADGKVLGSVVESGYAFNFDGEYLGIISYNGDVINKGKKVATAVYGNRVLDKAGKMVGFTVSTLATANTLAGEFLGRITSEGNVVKGRKIVGKIGRSGHVINEQGEVIGAISELGVIFDYLGRIRANSAVNGRVLSVEGIDVGYMQKNKAFDSKGKEVGKTLNIVLNYSNSNSFIGINGINSTLETDNEKYIISPYGYIFNTKGELGGGNIKLSNIFTPQGEILALMSSNGKSNESSLNEIAKLTVSGAFLDKNNSILGGDIAVTSVTDFYGENLGYMNPTNLVINNKNLAIAKVMPDGNIFSFPEKKTFVGTANQSQLGLSINGDYLGIINTDGSIKQAGNILGHICSDGFIVDNTGALYGKGIDFGIVVDAKCKFLGVVSNTGDARTVKDAYIGMILANGQVLNDSEEVVGRIITPRSVSGENGKSVGVQTRLGTAINYQNEILGCQDNLGKIRNAQGETVAQVIPMSSVMDFNNKIIGNVTNMNRVSNNENKDIGYVGLDGNVHSETGGDIGIIFEYKVAFDQNNVYLGRVNRQGQVISDTGDIIGQVMYNGEVYTGNGGKGYALYDLYVYDNKGNTFGYIAKNGRVYSIMGEIKGVISQGFVLDKRKNVIARGNRDYYIRNENQKVVGYLSLDGSVENNKGILVAQLQDNGDIQNEIGETLAKAQDLQYFHRPVVLKQTEIIQEQPKEEPIATEKEKIEVQDVPAENLSDKAQKEDKNKKIPVTHKVIGIAITPGGKYIGDVYNNDNVIDADGNIVGKVGENGQVFTSDGALIGKVEQTKKSEDTSINSDWLRQIGAGTTVSAYQHNNDAVNVGPGGGIGPGGRYNPRRAAIIANLQNQRRQQLHASGPIGGTYDASLYTGWQDNWGNNSVISTLRVDMSNVITGDKPIPAVLARSIVSLGEAPVTAIVERNIYGDAGRNVIIPAGSRIIGGFDEAGDTDSRFDNSSGGVKLDISWYRIIRPDGISFSLGGAETGDAQGRGGGALGYVDEQLLKKYTIPLLSTMSSSAIAYMMAANEDATGEVETSKQQAASDARENFLDKMDSIIDEIMESKNQIQAVTYVPAGTRIIIYPMVDLWLRTTKDIIEGRTTTANTETTSKDILIDENSQQVEGNQRVQSNQNVNNANNQQQNTSQPLIDDSGNGNQNTQNNNRNIGAIPPPAADGTISQTPIKDEDDNSGDIDLF